MVAVDLPTVAEISAVPNPWLKKNPFMSMWLSGAHKVAGAARGRIAAEAKRQTTTAIATAAKDLFSFWSGGAKAATGRQRKRRR